MELLFHTLWNFYINYHDENKDEIEKLEYSDSDDSTGYHEYYDDSEDSDDSDYKRYMYNKMKEGKKSIISKKLKELNINNIVNNKQIKKDMIYELYNERHMVLDTKKKHKQKEKK